MKSKAESAVVVASKPHGAARFGVGMYAGMELGATQVDDRRCSTKSSSTKGAPVSLHRRREIPIKPRR